MDNAQSRVASFYEDFWKDALYQQEYAFDSAVRDRFPAIRAVWGDLVKPDKVLDFGCGNGVLTYWLKCNGFGNSIVGVDVSKTGVENARRAYGRPGLRYEFADHLSEIETDSFDVVVSSHVLEHIDEPKRAVKDISRVAEWLVLEVPLEQCFWPEVNCFLRGKSRKDNSLGHVNFWNKNTFNEFMKSCGLLVVKDFHYASAPYSPFNSRIKRFVEKLALSILGLNLYSRLMATHYIVLARRVDSASAPQ